MLIKSYHIIRSLLFICVYSIFFIAQVFSNIAAAPPAVVFAKNNACLVKNNLHSQKSITRVASSVTKKSGIRLNKRFHPESIPSIGYSLTALLPVTLSSIKTSKPEDYLLIASILADSLRGPPVVA